MIDNNWSFCKCSNTNAGITTYEEFATGSIKKQNCDYVKKIAQCNVCKGILPMVYQEENSLRLGEAYRIKNDIILLSQVQTIPDMYDIPMRPLSTLLGWGINTYLRFYNHQIPSKSYSDMLKHMYTNPMYYGTLLDSRRNILTDMIYKKSRSATDKLIIPGKQYPPDRHPYVVVEEFSKQAEENRKAETFIMGIQELLKMNNVLAISDDEAIDILNGFLQNVEKSEYLITEKKFSKMAVEILSQSQLVLLRSLLIKISERYNVLPDYRNNDDNNIT